MEGREDIEAQDAFSWVQEERNKRVMRDLEAVSQVFDLELLQNHCLELEL